MQLYDYKTPTNMVSVLLFKINSTQEIIHNKQIFYSLLLYTSAMYFRIILTQKI